MSNKDNKLFKKNHRVTGDIRQPFGHAQERHVSPQHAPTSVSKDRVGSQTGAPNAIIPGGRETPRTEMSDFIPVQADHTIITKDPPNVGPGPDSVPWWRRDIKTVANGGELIILHIGVPEGKAFRLERIGHTFWSVLDEFWIIYDDKLLNQTRWAFPLGTPVNPYQLRVTVTAVDFISCFVRNRSGNDRLYEFFLDGWYDEIQFESGSRTS